MFARRLQGTNYRKSALSPRLLRRCTRGDVETVRDGVKLVAKEMAVAVECHRRAAMSKNELHTFHARTRRDRERRRGMPKLVRCELSALTGSRVFCSSKVAVVGVSRGEVIGGSFGVVCRSVG